MQLTLTNIANPLFWATEAISFYINTCLWHYQYPQPSVVELISSSLHIRQREMNMVLKSLKKVAEALIPGKDEEKVAVTGKVVLMKKNVLDLNDLGASAIDGVAEILGKGVSLHLIGSTPVSDSSSGNVLKGKIGKPAMLENWNTTNTSTIKTGESVFNVTFDWDQQIGVPDAFIINNFHSNEFYLKTVTLENVPGHHHSIHFDCNSWVYPADKYAYQRVFFSNQAYLPKNTPAALQWYREQELVNLRGDGTGERKEWDRVYDYDYYNDLGEPDKDSNYARPILGGSAEYPYPRRGRTGRPPSEKDPKYESRLSLLLSLNIYVPRDERFGHLKMSDFLGYGLKSVSQLLLPEIQGQFDSTPKEFDSFEDVQNIYEGGIKLSEQATQKVPIQIIKAFLPMDDEGLFKYPLPMVIKEDKTAWRTDEEFAREMLAGVNPVIISGLKEFPPTSNLDPNVYGNQTSTMVKDQIDKKLDGLTVDEAIEKNRMFILNHHDTIMPYLRRINATTNKTYASRTLLFLQEDGTLKPLAIELSLPHPDGDQFGPISKVYTPSAASEVENSIWQLAKAYVAVNDSGIHELISHWLRTHAVIEPIVVATNRQLSVLHPIYKLLHPHFRDTMNINALARQILINAGGVIESTLFPSQYAMEMSSFIYKDWVLPEQALPADLIKRKVAVEDPSSPHGVRLLIEDYPFAVDGLKIWSAIKTWVTDYCKIYYKTDAMIQEDNELQSWWKDVREKGHADKKDEPWWPQMKTTTDLIDSCTTLIWLSSAFHAATNFGQWPYAGYILNRPTSSRRLMPEPGSPEYEELKTNPEKVYLRTITAQLETLLGLSIIEILSRHSSDEIYLGQRENPEWTKDSEALEAFQRFGKTLSGIEDEIEEMNMNVKWRNRVGPVKVPYTLLFPTSDVGITGKGIPNSIAI